MSKIDLRESFDIEVQRREELVLPKMTSGQESLMLANSLQLSGHTSIHSQDPKGNTIDFEEGSNLIVTSGKKGIISFIIRTLDSGANTGALVATDRCFNRIALGSGGATSVASTDVKLVNELDIMGSIDSTWNSDTGLTGGGSGSGFTSASHFDYVKDATNSSNAFNPTTSQFSRELVCDEGGSGDFYMSTEDSGLTAVWYAKFTISGLSVYFAGTPSIIISEAGIVNQATPTETGGGDNYILARRTFTNKQVKDDDTLTITWKITIK